MSVKLTVEDPYGNPITTDNSNVTLALGTNPGNGTLSGNLTVAAANGVATFGNLSINKVGTGYILTATDGNLTPGNSSSFNVTAAAANQVVFTTQPPGNTATAPTCR